MIRAVLFDFDDTLCLTEETCFYLENEVAQKMGHAPMSRQVHKETWGKPLADAIALRIPGINIEAFMENIAYAQELLAAEGKIDIVSPENMELLDKLMNHGKKLGIITSRQLSEAKHLLQEDHPLASRMEAFYHKDNSTYIKPDPRVFDEVLKDFGVRPEEVVYVGDAPTDAIAAKGAGLHFIALLEGGIRTQEDFAGESVDLFVQKLPDILPYILTN